MARQAIGRVPHKGEALIWCAALPHATFMASQQSMHSLQCCQPGSHCPGHPACLPAMARQAIGRVPHKGEALTWCAAMPAVPQERLVFYTVRNADTMTANVGRPAFEGSLIRGQE